MRSIILIAFTILHFASYCQNFQVQNGDLLWQHVYENPENLPLQPLTVQLSNVTSNGANYSGTITKSNVNYTAYGMKRMQMPLYMTQPFSATVNIETKPGKYRVTVSNILFDDLADGSLLTNESTSPLADYAVTSAGEIKQSQKKALTVFEKDLTARFSLQQDSDW